MKPPNITLPKYMYPGVELRLLRYVTAVAEELNFTRASARLRVAQPSLSKQIQDLEAYLGVKLFERTKREVRLTPAGETFATEARQAIFHAQRAIEAARAAKATHKGRWTIGYSPLIDLRILARVTEHLSQAHPHAEILFASAHTSEQIDTLSDGTLQAGLVILPIHEPRLTCQTLYREPLILAVPPHHRLASKPELETADLHDVPLVTIRGDCEPRFGEHLERTFSAARIRKRVLHQTTNQFEALELVSHTGFPALVMPSAQRSADSGIVFRRFADDFLAAEMGIAYHSQNDSPILGCLRTFLARTFLPFFDQRPVNEVSSQQMKLFRGTIEPPITFRYSG